MVARVPEDALVRRTRKAARRIMRDLKQLPPGQRMGELSRVLGDFDPTLFAKTSAVANALYRRGHPIDKAVEDALSLSLADASIDQMRSLGERVGRSLGSLSGLGGAEDHLKALAKSLACSEELRTTAAQKAGEEQGVEAHAATVLGFKAAESMVTCPDVPQEDLTKPPPSSPTVSDSKDESIVVPVMVGIGAVALAGVAIWYMRTQSGAVEKS